MEINHNGHAGDKYSHPDQYNPFLFRIKWQGNYIAGFSKISGLNQSTEPVTYREGGDHSTAGITPGQSPWPAISLERGISHDPEFIHWLNLVWDYPVSNAPKETLNDFRKDLVIEIINEAGQLIMSYNLFRCWPSAVQLLPDEGTGVVAIESVQLELEGWERHEAGVLE